MTGAPEHDQEPFERWLADRHDGIRDGMSRFLDLDAGLHEVTLVGKHADMLGGLSRKLDIAAGLEAILTSGPAPESPSAAPRPGSGQPDVVATIKASDPAVRMGLRGNPIITAVIFSDFLIRALDIAEAVPAHRDPNHHKRDLIRVGALARPLVRDLARFLELDLERDIARKRDLLRAEDLDLVRALAQFLDLDLDRDVARGLALDFARALALELACDLASEVYLGLARELRQRLGDAVNVITHADRAVKLEPNLDRARDLNADLYDVRDLARDLARARALDLGLPFDGALDRGLTLDFARARGFNLPLDRVLDRFLGRAPHLPFDRASAITRDLVFARDLDLDIGHASDDARVSALHVALMAGRALGIQHHFEGLAAALLDGVLDDFTHADLTHIDITGLDLTGVRWSLSSTKWPAGTDVGALLSRSREVAPDSGIYVVVSPGDGNEVRHHVPV